MCLAIPGHVLALDPAGGDLATVDVVGVTRSVNIALLQAEGVRPGDWVLIHVGFAMTKIDEAEAHATLEALRAMGQIWDEELDALQAAEKAAEG
jgi:hydrogenase expression/formation protein HypC